MFDLNLDSIMGVLLGGTCVGLFVYDRTTSKARRELKELHVALDKIVAKCDDLNRPHNVSVSPDVRRSPWRNDDA